MTPFKTISILIYGFFLFIMPLLCKAQRAGEIDNTFNCGRGTNGIVRSIVIQPDGKMLIGGEFDSCYNYSANHITRLNTDGSIDNGFNIGIGANSAVNSILLQPDGKILVGGIFSRFNGVVSNGVIRLNSNGTIDNSFRRTSTSNFSNTMALQPDGKIILAGTLSQVERLNADGSIDSSFNFGTNVNGAFNSIAIQQDGKILIAGGFINYSGVSSRRGILRLKANGSLDSNFNITNGGTNQTIFSMAIQPDNKILIAGNFSAYNGIILNSTIVRLMPNGTLDSSFSSSFNVTEALFCMYLQNDGKIIVGGKLGGSGLIRLNSDGTGESNFEISGRQGISGGYLASVFSIGLQSDNKIIMGGAFAGYDNSLTRNICRIWAPSNTTQSPSIPIQSKLKIYPNPANDQFTIDLDKPTKIHVYNSIGQLVLSQFLNESGSVNTSSLTSGMYTVLAEGFKPASVVISK